MSVFEWYSVEILLMRDNYPFGTEGPTPYYYETPELYATVMLVSGLLFVLPLVAGIWALVSRNTKMSLTVSVLLIILIVAVIFHGRIGV